RCACSVTGTTATVTMSTRIQTSQMVFPPKKAIDRFGERHLRASQRINRRQAEDLRRGNDCHRERAVDNQTQREAPRREYRDGTTEDQCQEQRPAQQLRNAGRRARARARELRNRHASANELISAPTAVLAA